MEFRHLTKSLKIAYHKTVTSIAFYPALIAIGFLIFSWLMLALDFSEAGKYIKANYGWVRLKDASTARTIVSTISGGIISLMVFSFSMVMILLNQAASQMSNRMLESMIGNRFQQCVLGLYIGTIVYSLFLLSTIRDIESGIYVPALSIYLLLLITVADIFVFIYFLHYVTQSVKFQTIIERVHKQTLKSLRQALSEEVSPPTVLEYPRSSPQTIRTRSSGYFQGFDKKRLLRYAMDHNILVKILVPSGSFCLESQAIVEVFGDRQLNKEEVDDLLLTIDSYPGQPVDQNFYYGFHQLTEVALKALSPGINDPETAVLSLDALSDLFLCRLQYHQNPLLADENAVLRIVACCRSFQDLFTDCIAPIWHYGREDYYIQNKFRLMITQLIELDVKKSQKEFLSDFLTKVNTMQA